MNKSPIYIVDDDSDYDDLIIEAFDDLNIKNQIKFFRSAEEVLKQLKTNSEIPFMIISDVNLPGTDGFELREKVLNQTSLKDKAVPFIFWSTTASDAAIKKAYDLSVHGFFLKGRTFADLKNIIQEMVAYWSDSLAPQE